MSLLNKLFGSNKDNEKESINWKTLSTEEGLKEAIQDSYTQPVALFKHSTRCSISSMAKDRVERSWDFKNEEVVIYYLDLIAYRAVSNKIAETLDVIHQSPQLILLKNGEVIHQATHNSINVEAIKAAI